MKIIYVTSNKFKIELAKNILEPYGIQVEQKKIYCPELQDDSIEKVSQFSAKYAANELNCAVIKNDSGLCIDALNGFPGPYTAYCEDTITQNGILKLMEGINNRSANFVEVISYCEPNKEPISFVCNNLGEISKVEKGDYGWSYDKIFIPKGQTKTLAEFDDQNRWKFWSNEAYLKLKDYLLNNIADK